MADLLTLALVVLVVVLLAGLVNGIAGFGFALLSTAALATVLDPATAVVFVILPILVVNLTLASELESQDLRTCGRRFWPLLGAALVGTIVGMAALERIPAAPLRFGLGLLTLGYVALTQPVVPVPGLASTRETCFVERPAAMVGVGAISGVIFGATNVGVQLVAYLRSCDLRHGLFVGVVAVVFLGLNAVRVGLAGLLGLYPSLAVVGLSLGAALPALLGARLGARLRPGIATEHREWLVLALLGLVGARLVLGGLGV